MLATSIQKKSMGKLHSAEYKLAVTTASYDLSCMHTCAPMHASIFAGSVIIQTCGDDRKLWSRVGGIALTTLCAWRTHSARYSALADAQHSARLHSGSLLHQHGCHGQQVRSRCASQRVGRELRAVSRSTLLEPNAKKLWRRWCLHNRLSRHLLFTDRVSRLLVLWSRPQEVSLREENWEHWYYSGPLHARFAKEGGDYRLPNTNNVRCATVISLY